MEGRRRRCGGGASTTLSGRRCVEFVVPGNRPKTGVPRQRSRVVTLRVASGSMYGIGPLASGKQDARPDGAHVRHGVPQSHAPQLTLIADVMLPLGKVDELVRRVADTLGGQHDAGIGGFEVDLALLQGERLRHLSRECTRRGPAEKAAEAQAAMEVMANYGQGWLGAKPSMRPLATAVRWGGGDAQKQPSPSERGALIAELGRLVCSAANERLPAEDAAPQPIDELTARHFLASDLALQTMRDSAAQAAEAAEETAPMVGAKRTRQQAVKAAAPHTCRGVAIDISMRRCGGVPSHVAGAGYAHKGAR